MTTRLRGRSRLPKNPVACLHHAQDIIGVTIAIAEIIAEAFALNPYGSLWNRTHTCTSELPIVLPFQPYELAWTDATGGHVTTFFDRTPFDVDLQLYYPTQIVPWRITRSSIEPRTGFFAPLYNYPAT